MPLFITEGIKKGDALASRDLCAVALLGVWNWRGTNTEGGKVALPDWESVALNGRQVYIMFDSDVMVKQSVHAALVRLKAFLETRGARFPLSTSLPESTPPSRVSTTSWQPVPQSTICYISHATRYSTSTGRALMAMM